MGHVYLGLCGQQRAWESFLTVWSDISLQSAAWGGTQKLRREEHRARCLCQGPLPVPGTLMGVQRGQGFPGSSCAAAVFGRLVFALWRFFGFLSVETFSFCNLKHFFTGFLYDFSSFVCATSSVQVFCPNQISAHWQSDWFFHVGFLTWNSSKPTFWLHWLSFPTSLAMETWALAHPVVGFSYLPPLSVLTVPGLPAGSIWQGQRFAKLCLVHLIEGRVCRGWDYAFPCQKRAFCLKRLRALSIKTFLNPAITSSMLDWWFVPTPVPFRLTTNMV